MTLRPAAAAAALALLAATPAAAEGRLGVELNKLEPIDGGCRAYFLFRNALPTEISAYELSLAVLDPDGVIDRLLTVAPAPLPAGRTTLKIFEFEELSCDRVGEVIVHDIPACAAAGDEALDCWAETALASRAGVPLSD